MTNKNSKNKILQIKVSDVDLERLDFLCDKYQTTRSNITRELIYSEYLKLTGDGAKQVNQMLDLFKDFANKMKDITDVSVK